MQSDFVRTLKKLLTKAANLLSKEIEKDRDLIRKGGKGIYLSKEDLCELSKLESLIDYNLSISELRYWKDKGEDDDYKSSTKNEALSSILEALEKDKISVKKEKRIKLNFDPEFVNIYDDGKETKQWLSKKLLKKGWVVLKWVKKSAGSTAGLDDDGYPETRHFYDYFVLLKRL